MEQYRSNSHKSKELALPKEKIKPVVKDKVTVRVQSPFHKFVKTLIAEDGGTVVQHVLETVVIPGVIKVCHDAVVGAADRFFPTSTSYYGSSQTRYHGQYVVKSGQTAQPSTTRFYYKQNFEELIFSSKVDADTVLDKMWTLIEEYGRVSINDMYDAAGYDCSMLPRNSARIGWDDAEKFKRAEVRPTRGGYYIFLPPASTI